TLVPESPRWLLSKGRDAAARATLAVLHGPAAAVSELHVIQATLAEKSRHFGIRELFTGRLKRVLIFGLGIAFIQQATGINAIFYYLPTIFASSGGELSTSFAQSGLVGLVNVGMTFVAIWLIDRLGRKPLLVIGLLGATFSLLTISLAFHAQGPLGVAAHASHANVGFWNSLVSAPVTLIFPAELATWGRAGTFLGYGLLAAAGLLFVVMLAPE